MLAGERVRFCTACGTAAGTDWRFCAMCGQRIDVGAPDPSALRQRLVQALRDEGAIRTEAVAAAMGGVPRHLFIPDAPIEAAYRNEAVRTKVERGEAVSSASQPSIVAIMLEQLVVEPGDRVLEIGAGTGYNAALLAHLSGPGGQVISVDIDDDVVRSAQEHLATADAAGVRVERGDGAAGFAEGAPYDRIIVTAAAWDIAPAWREQLAPDGRLVLPLILANGQHRSVAFRLEEDRLVSTSIRFCMFMPLRGALAGPNLRITALARSYDDVSSDQQVLLRPHTKLVLEETPPPAWRQRPLG
jgi:protein-L-isoaspartate(D-aspartate) O-methyltransferase